MVTDSSSSSSGAWLSQIAKKKREGMFSLESPNSFQHIFHLPVFTLGPEWSRRWSFLYWNHENLACVHSYLLLISFMLLTATVFATSELLLSLVRTMLPCDCPVIDRRGHFCEGLGYSCIFVVSFSLFSLCADLGLFAKERSVWLIPFHTVKAAAYWGLFL